MQHISAVFSFNYIPSGRDFLVSFHIESTKSIELYFNGGEFRSGETLDEDDQLKEGINTVSISGMNETSFQINVYFFKMIDQSDE